MSEISKSMPHAGDDIADLLMDRIRELEKQLRAAEEHQQRELIKLAGIQEIVRRIGLREPLPEVMAHLAHYLETLLPETMVSVLQIVDGTLHLLAAPSLPGEYNSSIEGIRIGDGVGTCGHAAYHGKTVISEDIWNDPNWAQPLQLAKRFGLRSCWSAPVFSRSGKVTGTFACYQTQVARPTEYGVKLVQDFAHLAGLALDLDHQERELRNVADHLAQGFVFQLIATPDGQWSCPFVSDGIIKELALKPAAVRADASRLTSLLFPAGLPQVPPKFASLPHPQIFELSFTGQDGHPHIAEVSIHFRTIPDQQTLIDGVFLDITARKLAEQEALRVSRFAANQTETAAAQRTTPSIKTSHPPSLPLRGKLLIVEDEAALRNVLAQIGEILGLTVVAAQDGTAGLHLGLEHPSPYSAVILDRTLPGTSGDEVFRQLRAAHPSLPILITSGYSTGHDLFDRVTERDPHTRYLAKPYEVQEFINTLHLMIQPSA